MRTARLYSSSHVGNTGGHISMAAEDDYEATAESAAPWSTPAFA